MLETQVSELRFKLPSLNLTLDSMWLASTSPLLSLNITLFRLDFVIANFTQLPRLSQITPT